MYKKVYNLLLHFSRTLLEKIVTVLFVKRIETFRFSRFVCNLYLCFCRKRFLILPPPPLFCFFFFLIRLTHNKLILPFKKEIVTGPFLALEEFKFARTCSPFAWTSSIRSAMIREEASIPVALSTKVDSLSTTSSK